MTTTLVAGTKRTGVTVSATYPGTSSPDEVLLDSSNGEIWDDSNATLVVEFGIYIAPGIPPTTTVGIGSGRRTATLTPA